MLVWLEALLKPPGVLINFELAVLQHRRADNDVIHQSNFSPLSIISATL